MAEISNHKFIVFDIKDFYPSIKLIKAIHTTNKTCKYNKARQSNYKKHNKISFIRQELILVEAR